MNFGLGGIAGEKAYGKEKGAMMLISGACQERKPGKRKGLRGEERSIRICLELGVGGGKVERVS